MVDKYACFAALVASEPTAAYAIRARDLGTPIVVAAPHGGGIEPGTSEVAVSIAGDRYSYYLFEGMKARSNRDALHITSVNFDEPSCLSLLRSARTVLTVHGEKSSSDVLYIGGLDAGTIAEIRSVLEPAGFQVRQHPNVSLRALDRRNICNIGTRGEGVQLELSCGLRRSFFESLSREGRKVPTPRLSQFGSLIQQALRKSGL